MSNSHSQFHRGPNVVDTPVQLFNKKTGELFEDQQAAFEAMQQERPCGFDWFATEAIYRSYPSKWYIDGRDRKQVCCQHYKV